MKKPRKRRREYGPADFAKMMRGLADAAKQVKREEQLLLQFNPPPGRKPN